MATTLGDALNAGVRGFQQGINIASQLRAVEEDTADRAIQRRRSEVLFNQQVESNRLNMDLARTRESRAAEQHTLQMENTAQVMRKRGIAINLAEETFDFRVEAAKNEARAAELGVDVAELNYRTAENAANKAAVASAVQAAHLQYQANDPVAAANSLRGVEDITGVSIMEPSEIAEHRQMIQGLVSGSSGQSLDDPDVQAMISKELMMNLGLTGRLQRGISNPRLVPVDGRPGKFNVLMQVGTDEDGGPIWRPATQHFTSSAQDPRSEIGIEELAAIFQSNQQLSNLRQKIAAAGATQGIQDPFALADLQSQQREDAAQRAQIELQQAQAELDKTRADARKRNAEASELENATPENEQAKTLAASVKSSHPWLVEGIAEEVMKEFPNTFPGEVVELLQANRSIRDLEGLRTALRGNAIQQQQANDNNRLIQAGAQLVSELTADAGLPGDAIPQDLVQREIEIVMENRSLIANGDETGAQTNANRRRALEQAIRRFIQTKVDQNQRLLDAQPAAEEARSRFNQPSGADQTLADVLAGRTPAQQRGAERRASGQLDPANRALQDFLNGTN